MKTFFNLLSGLLLMSTAQAEDISSLVLVYDELEEGMGQAEVRYLVNDNYLRIDNGQDKGDFVLFDVKSRNVYSVNHEDRTILKIGHQPWKAPAFDFAVTETEVAMKDAPKINQQTVYHYQLKADDKVCTGVAYLRGVYPARMKVFYLYQQTLSGQQVISLDNTPKEFQTPCYLLDQVYHNGDYYQKGLPVQISYFSRGYEKFLKTYDETRVNGNLFVLPEGYREYLPYH